MHADCGKDKYGRNDGEGSGQLDHGRKISGCFTEGKAGCDYAGCIVDCGSRPEAEGCIRQTHGPAKDRKYHNHDGIEQEGGGHAVGDVEIVGVNDGSDCRDGRAAADAGSCIDQTVGFPVQPERVANERAEAEAGCQSEDHDGQREFSYGKNGGDVQTGTEKDDGEFQDFFGGEADAGSRCGRWLAEMVDQHANEKSNDGGSDEVKACIFFELL